MQAYLVNEFGGSRAPAPVLLEGGVAGHAGNKASGRHTDAGSTYVSTLPTLVRTGARSAQVKTLSSLDSFKIKLPITTSLNSL